MTTLTITDPQADTLRSIIRNEIAACVAVALAAVADGDRVAAEAAVVRETALYDILDTIAG